MAIDPADIRARIAAAVEAIDTTWTQSPYPFDLFPRDTESLAHQAFSVGISDIEADGVESSASRITDGAYVRTKWAVRWAYRIRDDAVLTDYDAALDAELVLIRTIMSVSRANLTLMFERATGQVREGGFFIGEVSGRARHRLQIRTA